MFRIINDANASFANKIKDYFFAIGYFSTEIVLTIVITMLIVHKQFMDLLFFFAFFYLNGLLNKYLRRLIHGKRPFNSTKFLASEHMMLDKSISTFGMPSGHSQLTFFSIVYLYLTVVDITIWLWMCFVATVMMLIQRWAFHNHTISQLLIGGCIGTIFAYISVHVKTILVEYFSDDFANIYAEIKKIFT